MVVVKLVGGLASQLHKYAVGKALANKLGTELVLDLEEYDLENKAGVTPWKYALGYFEVTSRVATKKELLAAKGSLVYFLSVLSKKLHGIFGVYWVTRIPGIARRLGFGNIYIADINSEKSDLFFLRIPLKRNIYITGEWGVGFSLFDGCRDSLIKEFSLSRDMSFYAKNILDRILECENSTFIHVRRGDFLNSSIHEVCSKSYYIKAIQYIISHFPDARFFVFSDDFEWVRNVLFEHLPVDSLFVENNANYEDFSLMSHCRHCVMSNSGFSAMASWVGQVENRVAVSPGRWFSDEWANANQMAQLPCNWVYID
ncbi:MAG: alpha-1,2-fucosyltransferase [Burkholderiaceae bacterium]|nr:alpha-1,2-fucosyltransferase [Burkholderiaceae bacterium]